MSINEKYTAPVILTATEAAWMLIGLVAVLGIAYYVGWYIGALNYAETVIFGG
jgi:hypothetical protein